MSETQAPVATATAKPLNALQLVEQQIIQYVQQKEQAARNAEQAVANVHALEGAIQAGQQLLTKLRAAEAEAIKLAQSAVATVESEVKNVATEVENKVVSIETAAQKL
jgi:hypothetical protein